MKLVSLRGAVVGALCLGAAIGQVIQHQTSSRSPWPPEPQDMVYVDWKSQGVSFPIPFPIGSSLVAYEVPRDKWFVLTGYKPPFGLPVILNSLSVVEDSSGTQTVKIDEIFGGSLTAEAGGVGGADLYPDERSPLGVAFRPGSRILLRNNKIPFTTPVTVPYAIAGYLVDSDRKSSGAWPPHPRELVTIASENFPGYQLGTGIRINSGEPLTIYAVPSKKRFVLTGGEILITQPVNLAENGPTGVNLKLRVENDEALFGPPIGIVFTPGTDVVITTEAFSDVRFGLSGYLVDA